ncbi:hypothetical protein AB0K24_50155 [Streptomyces mirabilis]
MAETGLSQGVGLGYRIVENERAPRWPLHQAVEPVGREPGQLRQVRRAQATARRGEQSRDRFTQSGGVRRCQPYLRYSFDRCESAQVCALAQRMPGGEVVGIAHAAPEGDDDAHTGRRSSGQERCDASADDAWPASASGCRRLAVGSEPRPGHIVVETVDHQQQLAPVPHALLGGCGKEAPPLPDAAGHALLG